SGWSRWFFGVRNACDQLDEATSATRHGLLAIPLAAARPRPKQRQGAGDGGSSCASVGRSAKLDWPRCCEITLRPSQLIEHGATGEGKPCRCGSRKRKVFTNAWPRGWWSGR